MSDRGNQDYSPGVRRFTTISHETCTRHRAPRPLGGDGLRGADHLHPQPRVAAEFPQDSAAHLEALPVVARQLDERLRVDGQECLEFPVNRGTTDAALVLSDAERGLAQGECLIFYPEGTATRDPTLWPMVAKTGVARLALSTGAPVIPVAQWGTQDILPYGTKKLSVIPRHLVKLLAGPPVDLSGYEGEPMNRDVLRAAAATIMADITGLLARLREQAPPAVPYDPSAARRAARQAAKESMQNDTTGPDVDPAGNRDPAPGTRGGDEPQEATPA